MKRIIFIALMIFGANCLFGQTVSINFAYDAAGNRVGRTVIITGDKSAEDAIEESIQDITVDENTNIKIFPNPTSGILNFEVLTSETEDIKVIAKVYSINGSLVCNEEYYGSSFTIDLSHEQNGTYVLDLQVNDKAKYFTIIKQ
jgi:hypothetical protein